MSQKLFYRDAYQASFKAKVLRKEMDENGREYLILDQTAFYPTGGGQPFDTGKIDDKKIVDVEEIDGEIRHYLESPFSMMEQEVQGHIDWERRFDHMQQHAGQHILSAAFDNLFGFKTVSFHLGREILTIDLDIGELSEEQAMSAEQLANRIILENRPIEAKWITSDDANNYPLRKQISVSEDIRLVIIPDFDYNGCGGTHPRSTGEVCAIKLLDWEKQKKKIRVQFVCGQRVLDMFKRKYMVIKQLTGLLNAPEENMTDAVVRLLESNKEVEKSLENAKDLLLKYEVKDLLKHNLTQDHIVYKVFQNRTIQELQKMARILVTECPDSFILLVAENDNMLQFVFARGDRRGTSMKTAVADALSVISGKGGGSESFGQGGGEATISGEELIQLVLEKNR